MLTPSPPGAPAVVLYTGVACPENPGPAGAGVLFTAPSGQLLARGYRFLGKATNNEAAYRALLIGLEQAQQRGYTQNVSIRTNSELVVRQLQGVYRVKQPRLQALHAQALTTLRESFVSWTIEYIAHHQNVEATRLANKALQTQAAPST